MFTSSCSATSAATKKPATRPPLKSRANYRSRCSPPTASLTLCRTKGNCSTFSPASAITAISPPLDACSRAIPNAISNRPKRWCSFSPISPKRSPIRRRFRRASNFHCSISATIFPKYPVPDGGSQMDFLRARAHDGLIHRYGSNNEKARRQIERELALIEKLESPRLFSDRLGHRALLQRAKHSRAGARFGGQQRGLLRARHHRGRSGRHGAALRAISLRRARRMARHRSRSCRAATSASARFNTSTSATANSARR